MSALLEREWQAMREHLIAGGAGEWELKSLRPAFFAGAHAAYNALMRDPACDRAMHEELWREVVATEQELRHATH